VERRLDDRDRVHPLGAPLGRRLDAPGGLIGVLDLPVADRTVVVDAALAEGRDDCADVGFDYVDGNPGRTQVGRDLAGAKERRQYGLKRRDVRRVLWIDLGMHAGSPQFLTDIAAQILIGGDILLVAGGRDTINHAVQRGQYLILRFATHIRDE